MKLFALHISYSTKLDLFIPFLTFLARIRIRKFMRIRIRPGQKHADPCGSGSETLMIYIQLFERNGLRIVPDMSEASKSCPSYRCQTSTIPSLVPELCTSYFQKHNMFYIHFSRNIKWTQECQRPKSCSSTLSTSTFLEKIDIKHVPYAFLKIRPTYLWNSASWLMLSTSINII